MRILRSEPLLCTGNCCAHVVLWGGWGKGPTDASGGEGLNRPNGLPPLSEIDDPNPRPPDRGSPSASKTEGEREVPHPPCFGQIQGRSYPRTTSNISRESGRTCVQSFSVCAFLFDMPTAAASGREKISPVGVSLVWTELQSRFLGGGGIKYTQRCSHVISFSLVSETMRVVSTMPAGKGRGLNDL